MRFKLLFLIWLFLFITLVRLTNAELYIGTSNPGVVYKYIGEGRWEPISPAPIQNLINIQSPHPYPNNYNNTWRINFSGALMVRIHFVYIDSEGGYDYIYVKDRNGNVVNTYSGNHTDIWTDWIEGDTVLIQLVSDSSVNGNGFIIDKAEYATEPFLGYAVLSLVEYNGQLYAGTMSTSDPFGSIGKVWRYEGGNRWTLIGDNMDNQVSSLVVYQGNLYAGTAWNGVKLYKYTPGNTSGPVRNWTLVIDYPSWSGVRSLFIYQRYLLIGDIEFDRIGRYDGNYFYPDLDGGGSCIYDFEEFNGYIYASAYEGGMWRSQDAIHWEKALDYYEPDNPNMWQLEEFKGFLYMAYGNGELRKTDGRNLRGELVYQAPDAIISMATDGEFLYFGTGKDAGAYYGIEDALGIANIYKYDGNNVQLISQTDQFGDGVQVILFIPKSDWSFVVISDLHIGYGCDNNDFGSPGWNDYYEEKDKECITVKALDMAVSTILRFKNEYNIKFVAVLGDISDSAEKSELFLASKRYIK